MAATTPAISAARPAASVGLASGHGQPGRRARRTRFRIRSVAPTSQRKDTWRQLSTPMCRRPTIASQGKYPMHRVAQPPTKTGRALESGTRPAGAGGIECQHFYAAAKQDQRRPYAGIHPWPHRKRCLVGQPEPGPKLTAPIANTMPSSSEDAVMGSPPVSAFLLIKTRPSATRESGTVEREVAHGIVLECQGDCSDRAGDYEADQGEAEDGVVTDDERHDEIQRPNERGGQCRHDASCIELCYRRLHRRPGRRASCWHRSASFRHDPQ